AVGVGTGAATAVCETGELDETLGDAPEEGCWDTGAAVQAAIQTSRTPAKRGTRCADIARKDNVPPLFAGPMRTGASGFLPGALRGASGGYPVGRLSVRQHGEAGQMAEDQQAASLEAALDGD